jgi:DNA-binding XRE family transcriptional regulator
MQVVRNYQTAYTLRALDLLCERSYTAPQLADDLRIEPRTALRLLRRLAQDGYAELTPGSLRHPMYYRLAPAAFRLGLRLLAAATERASPAPPPASIGEGLRAYRRARGFNQDAFADLVGVGKWYVSEVERGKRKVDAEEVRRLAERLGVDPSILGPAD